MSNANPTTTPETTTAAGETKDASAETKVPVPTRKYTVLVDHGIRDVAGKLQLPEACGGSGVCELDENTAAPLLKKGYLTETTPKKKN